MGASGTHSHRKTPNPVEVGKNTAANIKLEQKSASVDGEALRPSLLRTFQEGGGLEERGGDEDAPLWAARRSAAEVAQLHGDT